MKAAILTVLLATAGWAQAQPGRPGLAETTLASADAALRLADAATTYRFLADPCHCYHEGNPFAPHDASVAKIATFQSAAWFEIAAGERYLRRRGHPRLALALQVGDLAAEGFYVGWNQYQWNKRH